MAKYKTNVIEPFLNSIVYVTMFKHVVAFKYGKCENKILTAEVQMISFSHENTCKVEPSLQVWWNMLMYNSCFHIHVLALLLKLKLFFHLIFPLPLHNGLLRTFKVK